MHDFDVQSLGHQWLSGKGYELSWGLGRHVLGSQIFDYWYDPSRFILEHYGKAVPSPPFFSMPWLWPQR